MISLFKLKWNQIIEMITITIDSTRAIQFISFIIMKSFRTGRLGGEAVILSSSITISLCSITLVN